MPIMRRTHGKTHSFVVVNHVGHELASGCDGDPLSVAELVHAALLGQHAIPVHAVRRATGQRSEQVVVDFHYLFHALRTCDQTELVEYGSLCV